MEPLNVTVAYGRPGHEDEYVIVIDGFGLNQFIPMAVSDHLEDTLTAIGVSFDWVMNRGSRIEIRTDPSDQNERLIKAATQIALANDGFLI